MMESTAANLADGGRSGSTAVLVRELVEVFNACATALTLDAGSEAPIRELNERLAAVFPFTCRATPSRPATTPNRSAYSTPPALSNPFASSGNISGGARQSGGLSTPPGSAIFTEDDCIVRLTSLSRVSSSERVSGLGDGLGVRSGATPPPRRTPPPALQTTLTPASSTNNAGTAPKSGGGKSKAIIVVKRPPKKGKVPALNEEATSSRSGARSPNASGVDPEEEVALKEAIPAMITILEAFNTFLREAARFVATSSERAVNRMFDDDDSTDSGQDDTMDSSVILSHPARPYVNLSSSTVGITATASESHRRRSSSVGGRGDSLPSPSVQRGLGLGVDGSESDHHAHSSRDVPGFLSSSESAMWQSVVAVSVIGSQFIRTHAFCSSSSSESNRATEAAARRESHRSRSASVSGNAGASSRELPSSFAQPPPPPPAARLSPSVASLRKAVSNYVRDRILEGVYRQPNPQTTTTQHNQYDRHPPFQQQRQQPGFSPAGHGDKEGDRTTEEDRTIDRVMLPWWMWAMHSFGIVDDPIFLAQSARGEQDDPRATSNDPREQKGMGLLLAATDFLATCYVRAQLREGAAFDLATFLSYAGVDAHPEELQDSAMQPGGGVGAYDAATFTAVTALDSGAYLNDSLSIPEGTGISPSFAHSYRERGSLSRSSLPNPDRSAVAGGNASAFMNSSSGRLSPHDGGRSLNAGVGRAAVNGAGASRSMAESRGAVGESTDAYASHAARSTTRAMPSADLDVEDFLAVMGNGVAGGVSRPSYASMDRVLHDVASSGNYRTLATNGSPAEPQMPSSLFASAALYGSQAQTDRPVDVQSESSALRPSRLAEAEQVLSRAGKAIQFGVKLGALYATQDMNALLSLLPASTESPVAPSGTSAQGGFAPKAAPPTGSNSSSTNANALPAAADAAPVVSFADVLSPLEDGSRGPTVTYVPRGLMTLQPPILSPSTGATTPSFRAQSLPSSQQGGGGFSHERRFDRGVGVGFYSVPKGAGGGWGSGSGTGTNTAYDLHSQLRCGERRSRMLDVDDYIYHYFSSLRSPSAFAADPEVASELAFCISLMLLNRVVTTKLMTAPEVNAETVAEMTCSLFGSSVEVWRCLVPAVMETCVCALMQALDRQQTVLAQELSDFLAVLVAAGATGNEEHPIVVSNQVNGEVSDNNGTKSDRTNHHEDSVSGPTAPTQDNATTTLTGADVLPQPFDQRQGSLSVSVSRGMPAGLPHLHTIFPRMWVTSFTQAADMAKHLLSCGHGSPKPLESATWYLAGMADYLERVRVLLPPPPRVNDASAAPSTRVLLADVGSPSITHVEAARSVGGGVAVESFVREVTTNADSYFKVIVSFMEALADVFTRDVVEDGLAPPDDLGDASGSRNKFASMYHNVASRAGMGSGAFSGVGDDMDEEDYAVHLMSHTNTNREDVNTSVDGVPLNARRSQLGDGSVPAVDDVAGCGDGAEGDEGVDDSLKDHYKWMELCVHYFLEIFDVLMEASLHLNKKPLFLYTLVVGLTSSGSLEDSYPERSTAAPNATVNTSASHNTNTNGSSTGRFRDSSTPSGGGPGAPPSTVTTARYPYESQSTGADLGPREDSLSRLQHFLNVYCGMVVQRAVNTKFIPNTDFLAACGLIERVSGMGGAASGTGGTPTDDARNSNTNQSLSASTMQGYTGVPPQPTASEPQQSSLPEIRNVSDPNGGSHSTSTQSPARGTTLESTPPPRSIRPSTMWWPDQPFQSRRHLLRVTEHANLVSVFLREPPRSSAWGHPESDERDCLRAMHRRRNQLGGPSLYFSAVSSLLDTANGACTQLLSLPCACPVLAMENGTSTSGAGAHAAAAVGNVPSGSSSTVNAPLSTMGATLSAGGSATRSAAPAERRMPAGLTGSHRMGSPNRHVITSDRSLLGVCGGLWMRVCLLRLLATASAPMDRPQGARFSRTLRRLLAEMPAANVWRHYRSISGLLPCCFSSLPGAASATYVRLLFLRIVQAFYSTRQEGGGATVYVGPHATHHHHYQHHHHHHHHPSHTNPNVAMASGVAAEDDGGCAACSNASSLSPVLCQVVMQLWSAYFYQLLFALSSLCWHHTEAHTTATTLSIPSVLSRFLQVIMEDESTTQSGGSLASPNYGARANTIFSNNEDEEDEVGLVSRRHSLWRGIGGAVLGDEASTEASKGFWDFEDSGSDTGSGGDETTCKSDTEGTDRPHPLSPGQGTGRTGVPDVEEEEEDDRHMNPLRTTMPSAEATSPTVSSSTVEGSRDVLNLSNVLEGESTAEEDHVRSSFLRTQPPNATREQTSPSCTEPGEGFEDRRRGPGADSCSELRSPLSIQMTQPELPPLVPSAPSLSAIPSPPPLTVPKLSLAGLGPALYFASSGDTGAAQEAQLLAHTPCSMTTRPQNDRKLAAPNATTNIDDDHEEGSVYSRSARDTSANNVLNSAREVGALEESQTFSATPRTPVPELPALSVGTPGAASSSTFPPAPPLAAAGVNIPMLSLAGLGPALYFASSGDTGAFMELSALNPTPQLDAAGGSTHGTMNAVDAAETASSTLLSASRREGAEDTVLPPPLALAQTAEQRSLSPRNSRRDGTTSPEIPATGDEEASSLSQQGADPSLHGRHVLARSDQSVLSSDVCSGFFANPDDRVSGGQSKASVDSQQQQQQRTRWPPFVPPISKLPLHRDAGSTGTEDSKSFGKPSPCSARQRTPPLFQHPPHIPGFPGSANPPSPTMGAHLRASTPINPEIVAELIICLTSTILQRGSGFIQYSFIVSSLTQRRAHVSYAMSQPRMLYSILFDSSARSTAERGAGRFAAAAAATAAPHGPSTYHVVQSLSQYLLQRNHEPVAAILQEWLEKRYGELVKLKFAKEVVLPAREDLEKDREVIVTADTIKEELRAFPPFTLGHYVLLRLLLPNRKLLRNFAALRRIGSGGFGAVMSATPVALFTDHGFADSQQQLSSPMSPPGVRGTPFPHLNATAPPKPTTEAVEADKDSDEAAMASLSSEAYMLRFLCETKDLAVKSMPLHLQGTESGGLPVCHAEALAMLRLRNHPHISTAFAFGCTSKEYFLVTPEYTCGSFLGWRLKAYPPGCAALKQVRRAVPGGDDFTLFSICADLFTQVLHAVSYTHGHNIRHGDIKGDNVFVSKLEEVHALLREDAEAPSDKVKTPILMPVARRVRLGDFGSCDTCEDDDIRGMIRDLETGEARFLGGRWGSGKGTEAIQPPEMMVPKRRYAVLSGIMKDHRDLRAARRSARAARRTSHGSVGIPSANAPPLATAGGALGTVPAPASSQATTSTSATAGTAMFPPSKSRSTEEDENSELSGSYFDALAADLRRAELAVDMWACGCLLYEMLTGRMLFGEGRLGRLGFLGQGSEARTRGKVHSRAGPSRTAQAVESVRSEGSGVHPASLDATVRGSASSPTGSAKAAAGTSKVSDALQWDRAELLPAVEENVVNFLSRLLSLDPMQRPTAEEALYGWQEIIAVHPLMPKKKTHVC